MRESSKSKWYRRLRPFWFLAALGITYWIVVLAQYPALWAGYNARLGPIVVGMVAVYWLVWSYPVKKGWIEPPEEFREEVSD